MSNARKLVAKALQKTENGGYSNLVLKDDLKNSGLSSQDLKFASALFYGVLERRITLDYIIEKQSGRKIKDISKEIINILRIGVYQLLFMNSVPDSAAINESVKLVKNSRQKYLSGFTNAVLRNCQRNKDNCLPKGDKIRDLSVLYSCPEWIINSLIRDYGIENAVEFLKDTVKPKDITLRVNTKKLNVDEFVNKLSELGLSAQKAEKENYLSVKDLGNIEENPLYKSGCFHIQSLASAYSVECLAAKPNDSVLDVCAAPGGKSFSIAEDMSDCGTVVSCDIHSHRVKLIKNGAERLNLKIIKAVKNDAAVFNENFGKFDKILCDVPCSGLGVIGRKPDIKYKSEQNFETLSEIQLKILNTSAEYLKQSGRIVYSTCTLRKKENDDVVERFLSQNPDFRLKHKKTLFPHIDGTDGFFVAVIER